MSELVDWRREIVAPLPHPSTDRLEARRLLHGLIHGHLDADELMQLCYDLGVVQGDLGSGGHDDRIRELILMIIRQSRQSALLARLRELRPAVDWPDVV